MTSVVKFFASNMYGAPTLNGVAGSLIAVMDACLLNGFGLQTANSVVVAGNVATVNLPNAPVGWQNAVINVSGATPAGLNGDQRVVAANGNALTFATTGIVDQTATGTITVKVSPSNWTKPYSGTNLAAYKQSIAQVTGALLRVDDTAAQTARVLAYESMTGISAGTNPFPTDAQQTGGLYWPKSSTADSVARPWFIAVDDYFMFFGQAPNATYPNFQIQGFGDPVLYKSGDAYGGFISGNQNSTPWANVLSFGCLGVSAGNSIGAYMPRSHTGLGTSQATNHIGEACATVATVVSGGVSYGYGNYPNAADFSLMLGKQLVYCANSFRGEIPGVWHLIQNGFASFNQWDSIPSTGTLAGRNLLAILLGPSNSPTTGVAFLDVTGPWR